MTKLNIHEAKTHLSKYILRVQTGETIILCKNGIPVACLAPLPDENRPKRQLFGLARGMGKVTRSFFDPLTDKDFPGAGL